MNLFNRKAVFMPIITLVLIMAVLFIVSPVHADDGTPIEPTPAPEVGIPTPDPVLPTEEPTLIAPPPAETPVPTEEVIAPPAPTEEPTVPAEPPKTSRETVLKTSSEISGSALPTSPYYMVGTVTYVAGSCSGITNCVEVTVTGGDAINSALESMAASGVPTDRKLHIPSGVYTDTVDIDAYPVYGDDAHLAGLLALVGEGTEPGSVRIEGGVKVAYKAAGFSLANMEVVDTDSDDAAVWFQYVNGPVSLLDVIAQNQQQDSSGILIDSFGTVTLNRVVASGNGYHGARIVYPNSAVTVVNSVFNDNLRDVDDGYAEYDCDWDEITETCVPTGEPALAGLHIENYLAPVTLNGVTAMDNYGDGVDILAYSSVVTVKNSVFSHNFAVDNWGDGLYIDGKSIVLENLNGNQNGQAGIRIFGDVSVTGKGLWIGDNAASGLTIVTCFNYDLDPYCDNTGAGIVNLTTVASWGSQNGSGIEIFAKGAVNLTDTFTGWNNGAGYMIDNADSQVPGALTIKKATAQGNNGDGFEIYSNGIVNLFDIHARDNVNTGLYIDHQTAAAIVITNNPNEFNETVHNGWYFDDGGTPDVYDDDEWINTGGEGYNILTLGPVTITNLDSMDNGGTGGVIDNSAALTAAPVTINKLVSNGGYINAYQNNGFKGLVILSRGAVTISDLRANDNYAGGLYVHNIPTGTLAGVPVTISYSDFSGNRFDSISGNGVEIYSKGAITFLNISATDNQGFGAVINNNVSGTTAGVILNTKNGWVSEFARNWGVGLNINSRGIVTLNNLDAYENGTRDEFGDVDIQSSGVYVYNQDGVGSVTIKDTRVGGGTFRNNTDMGIQIISKGTVSIVFRQVNNNGSTGIYVNNHMGTGAVTITGNYSDASWNGYEFFGGGIQVVSQGNITLANVNANQNADFGADLMNDGAGNVSISNGYFDNNRVGLLVNSKGTIIWTNGSASGNYGSGAYFSNRQAGVAKTVTLTNVNATNNYGTGIFIDTMGAVTVSNSNYNNNSINEGTIVVNERWYDTLSPDQNWWFESTGADFTVDFASDFVQGNVVVYDDSWNQIASGDTDEFGNVSLFVDDPSAGWYRIFIYPYHEPLWGYTIGVRDDTWVSYSDQYDSANGLYINNTSPTFNAPVVVSNSGYNWNSNNSGTNVAIISSGAVTVSTAELNDCGERGLLINNRTDLTPSPVTVTGINFYNDNNDAIYIESNGVVSLKNIFIDNTKNGSGIEINNQFSTPAAVNLTNVTAYGSEVKGIDILSQGAVTLVNVEARWSGSDGVEIETLGNVSFNDVDSYENTGQGAYVDTDGSFTILMPTDGSFNSFNNNGGDGLNVSTLNKVTMTKVNAINNGYRDEFGDPITAAYGIVINNSNSTGLIPVSLTWVNADGNTEHGIKISTTSAVVLTKINANGNYKNGIDVTQNGIPVLFPTVTLTNVTANDNRINGLELSARGNIVVAKLNTNNNGNTGSILDNSLGKGTITILSTGGPNYTSFNRGESGGGYGLVINASGAVTISGIEFHGNSNNGLQLNNTYAAIPSAVTLNSASAQGNNAEGIHINSNGIITVNSSYIVNNADDGLYIVGTSNVFINNTAALNNGYSGFYIDLETGDIAKLTNCFWFGNLRDMGHPGDRKNLTVVDATLQIV